MSKIQGVTDLKDLIDEGLKRSRKLKEVYIKIHWKEIVGELAEFSFPRALNDRTLTVICKSSTYVHHMNMQKQKYIKSINTVVKEEYVTDIRFIPGSLESTEMKLFGGEHE